jgi:hypothetical protein
MLSKTSPTKRSFQNEGRALNSLIATYIARIIAQTGLSVPDHPPIHLATPTEMALRHGKPENRGLQLQALYNRTKVQFTCCRHGYPIIGLDIAHRRRPLPQRGRP